MTRMDADQSWNLILDEEVFPLFLSAFLRVICGSLSPSFGSRGVVAACLRLAEDIHQGMGRFRSGSPPGGRGPIPRGDWTGRGLGAGPRGDRPGREGPRGWSRRRG